MYRYSMLLGLCLVITEWFAGWLLGRRWWHRD